MRWSSGIGLVMIMFLASAPAMAGGGSGAWSAMPEGMFSPTPVQARTCVAVRVNLTQDQALSGVRWFNNDSLTVFPKIMVASGLGDLPPAYADGMTVAVDAVGIETGWSVATFSEPVASLTAALYVIFQLPANTEGVDVGQGPGFGYVASSGGTCAYLSSDGDNWSPIVTDYQLLVDPVYTDKPLGVVALSTARGAGSGDVGLAEDVVVVPTELFVPYPNPFNPAATVAFNLQAPGQVSLSVFDIRGMMVQSLVTGHLNRGRHSYIWRGRDQSGQQMASGVYFARLRTPGVNTIQRMLLLK